MQVISLTTKLTEIIGGGDDSAFSFGNTVGYKSECIFWSQDVPPTTKSPQWQSPERKAILCENLMPTEC